jgi:hypothetical protein
MATALRRVASSPPRRVDFIGAVIASGVAALVMLLLAAVAQAGPDPSLCRMTVARGAIPHSFAAEACFDGSTLTIRNNRSIPMSVAVRGAVGSPSRSETDYGLAALATRAVSTDQRMLLPGDTLRFPIGAGAAEVRLWGGENWGFYELASTVAAFIPGSPSADLQSFTALIKELNDDFTQYHACEQKGRRNLLRKATCHALLARNVAFAIGRAGVNALSTGVSAAILSAVTFSRWVSASVGDVGVLVHSGTIKLKAAKPTRPSSVSPWTTSGMGFNVPSSYTNTQPAGVSCASRTECVAVGSDFESADNQFTAVANIWQGQSWGEMALAETSGVDLFSVSCPTSSFCLAVGRTEFEGSQSSPVAEAWENGVWTAEQPLPSPDGGYANLFGVSCSTSTDCIAVGAQDAGSSTIPFAEQWSSGTWSVAATPDEGIELLGISCAATNWCVAVGGTQQGEYGRPLVEQWDGSRWAIVKVPGPPINKSNEDTWEVGLKAVSCASATSCVAVGDAGTVFQWDGRTWTLDSAQGGTGVSFAGVSCASTMDCAAVGDGPHGPVIESESGSRWDQEQQALGPKATLTDIALPPGGAAIAVGYQTTTDAIYPVAELRP